ncbi:MAG: hypothetical protein ABSB42_23270 [Tepidisphaeraceae bacterium]|jgi:hypothetical protein
MYDHLLLLPSRPIEKLDLFLCSNGGVGTVSWRIVALLREFATKVNVLIPYRAYSAATMIALGADEIVMHPFGELGPIDPTVSNDFNPVEGNRRLGISVEDVTAYVGFIKNTVGITHEDELIKAVEVLANKVHPLALGNVERFLSQSRMIARKILRTHMNEDQEHIINEIVENMASKLYFHGHAINRREAIIDLHLKVTVDLSPELETTMWNLYRDFENEFRNLEIFHPAGDIAAMVTPAQVPTMPSSALPQPQPIPQSAPPAESPANSPEKAPNEQSSSPEITQSGMPFPPHLMQMMQQAQPQSPKQKQYELLHVVIESDGLSSQFTTTRRFTEMMAPGPMPQRIIQEDVIGQGWTHQIPPQPSSSPSPRTAQSPADAQQGANPLQDKSGRKVRRRKA